jgi:hypothetical protein
VCKYLPGASKTERKQEDVRKAGWRDVRHDGESGKDMLYSSHVLTRYAVFDLARRRLK